MGIPVSIELREFPAQERLMLYRAHADEARRTAASIPYVGLQKRFEALAADWERMARTLEREIVR